MRPISERLAGFQKQLASRQELLLYGQKPKWIAKTRESRQKTQLLALHGTEYFSRLRPIFSHQISSFEFAERFSFFLLRDGALSLLWYFFKNPTPPSKKLLFLVNRAFSRWIPSEWQGQIGFYSIHSKDRAPTNWERVYLIATPWDEMHCSTEYIRSVAKNLRDSMERMPEICVVPVQGKECSVDYCSSLLQQIFREFGEGVRLISWKQLEGEPVRGRGFIDLNEFDFYYSDSAITESLLFRGAIPLFSSHHGGLCLRVDASFLHYFAVDFEKVSPSKDGIDRIFSKIRELRLMEMDSPRMDSIALCPPAFEEIVYELVSGRSRSRHSGNTLEKLSFLR